jgi:two-component system, sensor histidine kinase and response regulator
MKNTSILVVDDEPDNFDVIETFLSKQDYQLYYAASGEEAIAFLETYSPSLILLDVMMPGIDGIEVCRQLKASSKWQAIPVIMVTALSTKSDLAYCLESGADDFISKPVNAAELRARVQSMLRIKHQYDEVQALLKSREDMVNMIVHDLRNPLCSIILGLELLGTIDYKKEKRKQKIGKINESAKALQNLIDNLLKVASMESGKICLNLTEVDLGGLISSSISRFEAIAAQKNQLLVYNSQKIFEKKHFVDVDLTCRVLDNLLSNAIKFSPSNSQIIAKLEFLESGDAVIQIVDSGSGIADELQHKIFEKYEIGTLMPGVSQIGLGLAFCKMVVEAHGGKISVKNNQPKGAIFKICLPVNSVDLKP